MELLEVLLTLVVVVVGMLVLGVALLVDYERLRITRREFRDRIRVAIPFFAILGLVLLINAQFRQTFEDISHVVGFEITPMIENFEGTSIVHLQTFLGEQFIGFFSFMYVYGYVFLLVFPILAYFVLERMNMFKSLTIAYAANYAIGLFCYILFIAYGPRNQIPELLYLGRQPMYEQFSMLQLLTSEVNRPTNVFPSLHTSLSATVMLFAWRTREEYPRWLAIATFFGVSIIVSTMYLGIHWFIDVLAGLGLAALSYWIGLFVVEREFVSRLEVRQRWGRLISTLR